MKKLGYVVTFGICLTVGGIYFSSSNPNVQKNEFASTAMTEQNSRTSEIQRTFDNRCVVCHSCNNAPCQLNLTSFSGLSRGMTQARVYDASRKESIMPTRLDIDATSEPGWRQKSFSSVLDTSNPLRGQLARTLLEEHVAGTYFKPPAEIVPICEKTADKAVMPMPYGLPPLAASESQLLLNWIQRGAPGSVPSKADITSDEQNTLLAWQGFLNETSPESRLVSRYLYEHLFLAHLHFSTEPKQFFRLVRSRTACSTGASEIATRRPNDSPGVSEFYYCFQPLMQTIVEKTHLPYLLNGAKLQWMKKNFFSEPWQVSRMPSYDAVDSANPFVTFEAIPTKARYQFLLEDAQYHVATFIKGPVCNGTQAVNSIDDQFYVFFMDPSSDLLVKDPRFREASKQLLVLPAEQGSDGKLTGIASYFSKYPTLRNQYRQMRADAIQKNYPQGLSLDNIWNGDGKNENSVLTVLRNNDNSYVLKGPRGDAAHSAYVLDYGLFERLVYNLVVGFDVYGNVTHQLHTRVYMGMIRMEGENNFLDFFPAEFRNPIVKSWYSPTLMAALEKKLIDKPIINNFPSMVRIVGPPTPEIARAQMYEMILSERLPYMVRRYPDPINWKTLNFPTTVWSKPVLNPVESELSQLSVPNASGSNSWVRYLPDTSLIVVKSKGQVRQIYTMVKNKKFRSEGSLLFEDKQRLPENDDIMILPELATSYPNYFFIVDENEVGSFTQGLHSALTDASWQRVLSRWGLARNNSQFWWVSDQIQSFLKQRMGLNGGVIDYTHYDVWTK